MGIIAKYSTEGQGFSSISSDKEHIIKTIKNLTYVKTDQKAEEYIFKDSKGRKVVFDVLYWAIALECNLKLLK